MSFQCRSPGCTPQSEVQTPCSSGRTSIAAISLPTVGCCTKGVNPRQTASSLLLPISLCLFLFILSCGKSFLLVFRSFSEVIALYVVAILVYLWEVSTGSSHSTILSHGSVKDFFPPKRKHNRFLLSFNAVVSGVMPGITESIFLGPRMKKIHRRTEPRELLKSTYGVYFGLSL